MYRAFHNNIDKSNPFQSNITPRPYDLSSQLPPSPIAANSFIGSPLPEDKLDHVFCLLCGNPNGFNFGPQEGNFINYCKEVYRFQTDTSCLYEHNLDSYNHAVKNILYKTTQCAFDHSKLTTTSSPIPATSTFKPGGTMILTQGSCISRLISCGHNEMGRWSYHTYSCKNFHRLTITSVYQPCNQRVTDSGRVRTLTVTAQHTSLLRQQGRHKTPRQAFIIDLHQFITNQHAQGNGVLLAGDYNKELDIMYDGITKLCSNFHLVDLMFHLTDRDDFATYAHGSKCIDYILCNTWVSDASLQGCYEPFQYRLKGDHCDMVVDFNTNLLFGNPTTTFTTPAQREFSSKDAGSNRKYIQNKHKYLTQHHFASCLAQLQEVWDPDLSEQLDRDFQRGSSSAAKSV